MIVKNGGDNLRRCLQSAQSVVRQIVIADTGSTDNTRAIAAEFNAQVIPCVWNDHFADARNAALEPISTDWVLVLDADEELAPEACAALPALVARTAEDVGGYQATIRNYNLDPFTFTLGNMSKRNTDSYERAKIAPSYTEHQMTRLFRRRPEIRFCYRIHEQVDRQIRNTGMKVEAADFLILHFGNLQPVAGKRAYYRQLCRQKIDDNPASALAWFEAGGEEFTARNYSRALRYFEKSYYLEPSPAAAYFIAYIHRLERRFPEALQAAERIPTDCSLVISKLELEGEIHEEMNNLPAAQQVYAEALRICRSVVHGDEVSIQTLIESRLGYVEVLQGCAQEGIPRMERAALKLPHVADLHDRLVKAWVLCRRDDKAAVAQEHLLCCHVNEKGFARAIALHLRAGNQARAEELLKKGLELMPDSKRLLTLRGRRSEVPHPGLCPLAPGS